jgi:hypothetical protein
MAEKHALASLLPMMGQSADSRNGALTLLLL